MLEMKYAKPCFSRISKRGMEVTGGALLLKISIVTGWILPQAEILMVLQDQFTKYLVENYPALNSDEVEYAFRNRDTGVRDWGKNLNLSLVDEVLLPYMAQRRELSKLEEQKPVPVAGLNAPKMEDQEKIDLSFDMWKSTQNFVYIDENVFLILEKSGLIKLTNEEKKPFMSAAIAYMKSMEDGKPDFFGSHDPKRYQQIYARKLAVQGYFKTLI